MRLLVVEFNCLSSCKVNKSVIRPRHVLGVWSQERWSSGVTVSQYRNLFWFTEFRFSRMRRFQLFFHNIDSLNLSINLDRFICPPNRCEAAEMQMKLFKVVHGTEFRLLTKENKQNKSVVRNSLLMLSNNIELQEIPITQINRNRISLISRERMWKSWFIWV